MSYSITFEPTAQEELDKLSADIIERIINKLSEAKDFPEHFIEKLKEMPEFKIRVGDYRVILIFDKRNKLLRIQAVSHRKNIYKKYKTD